VFVSGGGACTAAYFIRFYMCQVIECAVLAIILFHMFRYVAKLTLKAKDRASSAQYEKARVAMPVPRHRVVSTAVQTLSITELNSHTWHSQDCKMQMIAVDYAKK
jgi:hypothetical protein